MKKTSQFIIGFILLGASLLFSEVKIGYVNMEKIIAEYQPLQEVDRQLQQEFDRLQKERDNLVVRFAGIYGPGRKRILRIAAKGDPIQYRPPYYTNRIHKEDCLGVLIFLFEQRLTGKKLYSHYLASDDEPAPMWEVVSWLAKRLKCKQPEIKQVDKDAAQNKRCCNKRLKELGYRFQYPTFREGYPQLIHKFSIAQS